MKKLSWVKWLIVLGAGIYIGTLLGCIGSPEPRNPMVGKKGDVWWRTPYTRDTPRDENPWLAYVKDRPNEFDPWANDDLQQYSVSPIFTGSTVAPLRSTTPAGTKSATLEGALNKSLQEFLRERLERERAEREVF